MLAPPQQEGLHANTRAQVRKMYGFFLPPILRLLLLIPLSLSMTSQGLSTGTIER